MNQSSKFSSLENISGWNGRLRRPGNDRVDDRDGRVGLAAVGHVDALKDLQQSRQGDVFERIFCKVVVSTKIILLLTAEKSVGFIFKL